MKKSSKPSASSQLGKQTAWNGDATKNKLVRYRVDLESLRNQVAELKALKDRPDSEIDFSYIPPLSDDF